MDNGGLGKIDNILQFYIIIIILRKSVSFCCFF